MSQKEPFLSMTKLVWWNLSPFDGVRIASRKITCSEVAITLIPLFPLCFPLCGWWTTKKELYRAEVSLCKCRGSVISQIISPTYFVGDKWEAGPIIPPGLLWWRTLAGGYSMPITFLKRIRVQAQRTSLHWVVLRGYMPIMGKTEGHFWCWINALNRVSIKSSHFPTPSMVPFAFSDRKEALAVCHCTCMTIKKGLGKVRDGKKVQDIENCLTNSLEVSTQASTY